MTVACRFDGTLHQVVELNEADDGPWLSPMTGFTRQSPDLHTFWVSIRTGSGSWVLEGRNSPDGPATEIDSGKASKSVNVSPFKQYRLRWLEAADLTARASFDCVLQA